MVSRSTWLLSLGLHRVLLLRHHERVTPAFWPSITQARIYGLVAVGLSVVEMFNSYSMSILPGSLYMMLKGSDVGWSMLLSYLCLPTSERTKAKMGYTWGQIVAVGLIMAGIAMVFLLDDGSVVRRDAEQNEHANHFDISEMIGAPPKTTAINGDPNAKPYSVSIIHAAILCLVGAFLNAICSVGTEAMLKKTLQQEEDRLQLQLHRDHEDNDTPSNYELPPFPSSPPSKLFLSNTYSMWTSFFSFLLLGIPVLWKERYLYNSSRHSASGLSSPSTPNTQAPTPISANGNHGVTTLVICLVLLALSRFLERLAKYAICVYDSAVTFSIVQAARRWSGIYIVGILFYGYEHLLISRGMVAGSLMSGLGFMLHAREATTMATASGNSQNGTTGSRSHKRPNHIYSNIVTNDISDTERQKWPASHTSSQISDTDERQPLCDEDNDAIEMPKRRLQID